MTSRVVSLFAGPGGIDVGARLLGLDVHGVDLDIEACATARAAGFERALGSVVDLDPEAMRGITGAVITPPCPTWSTAGKRSGVDDLPHVLAAIERLGDNPTSHEQDVYGVVSDARSGLVTEALRIALGMPHLQWLVCEQVPAVAPVWQEIAVEMAITANFSHCLVLTIRAEDLGVASRRTRTFLIATRHHAPILTGLPFVSGWRTGRFTPPTNLVPQTSAAWPRPSMATALGWPAGERVNTRGNRRTSGGNEFSADGPSWCLTEKARTWYRVSDGQRLTPTEAGLLVGFNADYPWQGSRSKAFLQAADVVPPPVAAAVIGATLRLDWQSTITDYLAQIYPTPTDPWTVSTSFDRFEQPSLFTSPNPSLLVVVGHPGRGGQPRCRGGMWRHPQGKVDMTQFSLDIGVASVADHSGHLAYETTDTFNHLRAACTCGWSSHEVWDNDAAGPGGEPSQILVGRVEAAWIRHVYDDVVPADRAEQVQRLTQLLRRLGQAQPGAGTHIADIHRDLTAATDIVTYLVTAGTPQWRDITVPDQATLGSIARSAAADIGGLAETTDLEPEQSHQIADANAQLADRLRDVTDHISLSLQRRRTELHDIRGRKVDVDETTYQLDRAAQRFQQAEEHLHKAAWLLAGLRINDIDDEY